MAAITFTVEIDPKAKKNGLHEIRIRLTQNRKHLRFNVGYAIQENHWNKEKKKIRSSHPLATIINAAITTKIRELEKQYLSTIPTQSSISMHELHNKAKAELLGQDFLEFFLNYIDTIQNGSTAMTIRRVYNKLKAYQSQLFFSELTPFFIKGFEMHLRNNCKNIDSTVHHNIRTIKSIYNKAIKTRHYIPVGVSPFYGYTISKGKSTRSKLQEDEIELLENVVLKEGTKKFHARNFFLLSYYMLGIRVSSMIKMRFSYFNGNRCAYSAAKGEKKMDIIVIQKAQEIVDYYKQFQTMPDGFVFPFLKYNEVIDNSETFAKRIESITSAINNKLKQITKELGINKKITTHVARHSFAYTARRKSGNDIYAVQKALGHSSISITEAYFQSDETIEADELTKKVFG